MWVISRAALIEFCKRHPNAKSSLYCWYSIIKVNKYCSFDDLKKTFRCADQVTMYGKQKQKVTVFNIGGNKYRLVVAIHYNTQKVFIRHVLTHSEYDNETWKRK